MRIAIVVTNKTEYNISHYNAQEIGLGRALVRRGHKVDIFCYSKFRRERILIEQGFDSHLTLHFYNGIGLPGRQTWPSNLYEQLEREQYDIAHLHEYPWIVPTLASKFLKQNGTKTILIQGMYQNFDSTAKGLYNVFFDKLFLGELRKNIDFVICKSDAAQAYMNRKGFIENKTRVIPVGLDVERFESRNEMWSDLDSFLHRISSFSRRLLYVGILEDRRKPLFLLELLKRLLITNNQYVLIIVGDGPLARDIREFIRKNSLEYHVVWIPDVPHQYIARVYELADILLLPSTYEIFGMVLLEALYLNKPVITTPTAGARQIIKNEKIGTILPLRHDEWIERIEQHYNNNRHSEDTKTYVQQKFSWSSIAEQYESVYNTILL